MLLRLLLNRNMSSTTPSILLLVVGVLLLVPPKPSLFVTGQEYPNPLYTTNQFNNTVKFRQNVCDRMEQYATGQIASLEDALEGMELRVSVRKTKFFHVDDVTDKINPDYPGLAAVILDEVARRGKFTWRDSFATLGNPIEDKSYTDLLVWATDTYDVAISWWDNTLDRVSKGINYPESWYDASYVLVGKTNAEDDNDEGFDPWSWLAPFDYNVWALTLATIIVSGFIYMFLDFVDPYSDKRSLKKKPGEAIFMSAMGFAGHMEFEAQTHPARLFTFSLAMWALLMGAAYTANLASFLVVKNASKNSINSIEDAVKSGVPICIWDGTQSELYLREAFSTAVFVEKETELESIRGMLNGDCRVAVASLGSLQSYQRDAAVNQGCQLRWIGRKIKDVAASFATIADSGTLCTSLIRDVFNVHMRGMREDGFIQQAWEDDLQRTATMDCSAPAAEGTNDSNNDQRRFLKGGGAAVAAAASATVESGDASLDAQELNIKNMGGIFLMHGGLSMIAIIAALVHRYFGLTARRDKERREKNLRRHMKKTDAKRDLEGIQNPEERPKALRELLAKTNSEDGDLLFTSNDDLSIPGSTRSSRDDVLEAKIDQLTKQVEALTKMINVSNRTGITTSIGMDGSLHSGDYGSGQFSSDEEEVNDVR